MKIDLKLYNLADDLEKKCRAHLKRIMTVLQEFDIHDEKHSEKVNENIELLLGDDKLDSLSTYELFLLHLSAFFHDCAMAPSDWEINTMKLTEGNEQYFQDDFSIKQDLKTPLKFSIAKKTIIENKLHLYKNFKSDVKNWIFTPHSEEELINYLSSLLIEYQNYRNGFADKLKSVKNNAEFAELNEFIRIDYIRATHHTRVETYIKNLGTTFGKAFEQPNWGKGLAKDLSLICRSHGEDVSFIEKLNTNAQYCGSENANLQFVSMLLRLGDIIHFSYDRAPVDLRSSKLFKSEYSFQQWAIKNSGVNYSIDKGKILFRAYCENPDTYFKLHQYIDWIEIEIQNYFRFQRQWSKNYIENLQDKVGRSGITNDDESFLPKRGLSFSLNQTKIIDLLMGVGLYKDKYACLRELYQNSLDAVRCMLSQCETENCSAIGNIEFRIDKEDDKTYLCCIDNGIGMTKEVIENYLLKIGNSYYKSADFYKQQAKWGSKFTPISQFGIGILSCFMIGDKIEISTKTIDGEFISCAINGPHENFYYKTTSLQDKEDLLVSGTIVKVFLNDETASEINNKKLNKIGLLLLTFHEEYYSHYFNNRYYDGYEDYYGEYYYEIKKYVPDVENWAYNLFNIINRFVQIVPKNINFLIGFDDNTKLLMPSNPILIEDFEMKTEDFEYIDFLSNNKNIKYADRKNYFEIYKLYVKFDNTEYLTILMLPKQDFVFENPQLLSVAVGKYGICIDGVAVTNQDNVKKKEHYYSKKLSENGKINFLGEIRPQLSIDRESIINYPECCEKVAEEISKLLIKKILDITKEHIIINDIQTNSNCYNLVWSMMFKKIRFASALFINEFSMTEYGDILWEELNDKLSESQFIRNFLMSKSIIINNYNILQTDCFTQALFLTKLFSSTTINVENANVSLEQENLLKIPKEVLDEIIGLLICVNNWNVFDEKFDLISSLYPLVPKRLFDLLDGEDVRIVNNRMKIAYDDHFWVKDLFFQSPLSINEKLGLYDDSPDDIYEFYTKQHIDLDAINDNNNTNSEQEERYVLVILITPLELTSKQKKELEKYTKIDPSYVKGVSEGWSLLATGMEKENVIIYPGITTREHLVSLISNDFWETYKNYSFKFTDNSIMKKA